MATLIKKIQILTLVLSVAALLTPGAFAQNSSNQSEIQKRINSATDVLHSLMKVPEKGIPDSVMNGAQCVVVIPSQIRIAISFGGRHGKGVATCRNENTWSAPVPVTLTGGSWGLQLGGEAVDLVMVVMDRQGAESLLASKFKIGAGASGAFGPWGRDTSAGTNVKFRSKIITYSRARGLFAGINLHGAVIGQDKDETRVLYGKWVPFDTILAGKIAPPQGSHSFQTAVARYATQARQRSQGSAGSHGAE